MPAQAQNTTPSIDPIYSMNGTRHFDGLPQDAIDVGHRNRFELDRGTISLGFTMDETAGDYALISKDGSGRGDGGQFTVWVKDGALVVSQESATGTEWLEIPDFRVEEGTEYQFAMTFGNAGLELWINGELVAAEPEFAQGMSMNERSMVIGGSRAWRGSDDDDAHSVMRGSVSNVQVFDRQLNQDDMVALANGVEAGLGQAAAMSAAMADLAPVFTQLHHASHELQSILAEYGVDAHGHMSGGMRMKSGNNRDNTLEGRDGRDGLDGGHGDDNLQGKNGNDVLQGGYGNDRLLGGQGRDILDGGHGEDVLNGGSGADLLISRSDGREGRIAYVEGRDEDDPWNGNHRHQMIPADDILIGGRGADIFYFQTLINAQEEFIREHTNDDGTINWHRVAGENNALHDHWVDTIGNDVIMDFSRGEGDRIVIEGHTTYIDDIAYGDANGDGVMDHSIITLYSDQGSGGGAHHMDQLGTITVYGDLVRLADITHTASPAYGIVESVEDLREALVPLDEGENTGRIRPPQEVRNAEGVDLPGGLTPVFSMPDWQSYDGWEGEYLDPGHHEVLEMRAATISLGFSLDGTRGEFALVSMDSQGRNDGDFTVWIDDGTILISQETTERTEWLRAPDVHLEEGVTYHFALSMGPNGLMVWLDGQLVASEPEFAVGLTLNDNSLVVGGSRAWRSDQDSEAHSLFRGDIGDVHIFDRQLGESAMIDLAGDVGRANGMAASMADAMDSLSPILAQGHHGSYTLRSILEDYGFGDHDDHSDHGLRMRTANGNDNEIAGNDRANGIDGGRGDDRLSGEGGDDVLQGGYGNDRLMGGTGNDILDGGEGEDILIGGGGADLLISRSDGREPRIADVPGRDEYDPWDGDHENQRQPANDVLTGGAGADIFYFQTLINAQLRFIREHTNESGEINWHGVAGENDGLHDHWVDHIGNDRITDFSRDEGDRIVIEGHTTYIDEIEYQDRDNDGTYDTSIIHLYSDQGSNGGAHHLDRLGTITVRGDLVRMSDIEHTASPAYGIITSIEDLREANRPLDAAVSRSAQNIQNTTNLTKTGPENSMSVTSMEAANGVRPVFEIEGSHDFVSEDRAHLQYEDRDELELSAGTVSFSFEFDWFRPSNHLFSRDADEEGDGDVTTYVNEDGDVVVRFQSDDGDSHYLIARNAIELGVEYDLAFSFGDRGAQLFLDGVRVAYDADLTLNWEENTEALIVGAGGWGSRPGETNQIGYHINGTISDFAIYDSQLSADALYGDMSRDNTLAQSKSIAGYRFEVDGDGHVTLQRGRDEWTTEDGHEYITFKNAAVRVVDVQVGNDGGDSLIGEDGADVLIGNDGDDYLRGNYNDDLLRGGRDDDTLSGGSGRDWLFGESGDDNLTGGAQRDRLSGGAGDDDLKGGSGNDRLFGGRGDDFIYGNAYSDDGDADLNDRAIYRGDFADYSIDARVSYNSSRGENMQSLIITDRSDGGSDGIDEGQDRLYDIDYLVFNDQVVAVETFF